MRALPPAEPPLIDHWITLCVALREPTPIDGSDARAVGYYRSVLVRCTPQDLYDLVAAYLSEGSARWDLSESVVLTSDETLSADNWERLESTAVEGIWHARGRAWFTNWD
jgi:hypothetical protein